MTWILWRLRLLDLARVLLVGRGRFILQFHGIAPKKYSDIPAFVQPSLTVEDLGVTLAWLRRRFAFLTPEAFLASDRGGVLLTFDDGPANYHKHVLPVLEEHDAPAIFFVSTQHVLDPRDWLAATRAVVHRYWRSENEVGENLAVELYDGLSIEQVSACALHPLITIGSHTVSHPVLTQCKEVQLEYEVASSKTMLSDWTGRRVDLFAYPSGAYDLGVAEAVRAAGYRAAFAVEPRNVGLPAFEIPRIGIYSAARHYLSAKMSGLHRRAVKWHLPAGSGPC